jgi:cellulase/cellobiase CelA1
MRFTCRGALPRSKPTRPHLRRRIAMAVPALMLGLGLVATAGSPASAATGCSASYATQSQWSSGFVAGVTISNTGTSALSGWRVTFTFGGDQKVTSFWGASMTQSGENVTASNASYNGTVAAGSSASFGLYGTWASSDAAPTSLTCTPAGGAAP